MTDTSSAPETPRQLAERLRDEGYARDLTYEDIGATIINANANKAIDGDRLFIFDQAEKNRQRAAEILGATEGPLGAGSVDESQTEQ